MQAELANMVSAVVNRAVVVREALESGEALTLINEQAALKKLLLTDLEARRWVEFGGDVGPGLAGERGAAAYDPNSLRMPYLGARYALTCWLDEVFIAETVWSAEWNEQKLELSMYGTNDRAWKFWEQARIAESRPGTDALEVYFLCVMLGFRGDLTDQPARLREWVMATRARLGTNAPRDWPAPPSQDPPTYVPPLRGRESLRRMVLSAGMLLLVLLPVVAYFIVEQLNR